VNFIIIALAALLSLAAGTASLHPSGTKATPSASKGSWLSPAAANATPSPPPAAFDIIGAGPSH
jgi:hypothetical protein